MECTQRQCFSEKREILKKIWICNSAVMGHRIWNDLDKEMKYGSGVGEKELISILSLRQISCADFGEKKCVCHRIPRKLDSPRLQWMR